MEGIHNMERDLTLKGKDFFLLNHLPTTGLSNFVLVWSTTQMARGRLLLPHTIYESVYLELIKILCNGAKHHSSGVGVIYACALGFRNIVLTLFQSNRVSAIYAYVFFPRLTYLRWCSIVVPC